MSHPVDDWLMELLHRLPKDQALQEYAMHLEQELEWAKNELLVMEAKQKAGTPVVPSPLLPKPK